MSPLRPTTSNWQKPSALRLRYSERARAGGTEARTRLTIEQRVADVVQRGTASIDDIRSKARQEVDEAARLRVVEKDQTIQSTGRTIEELKRKAERGPQQAQGEALEADPEEMLRARFPMDAVERVAKGELGALVFAELWKPDILQAFVRFSSQEDNARRRSDCRVGQLSAERSVNTYREIVTIAPALRSLRNTRNEEIVSVSGYASTRSMTRAKPVKPGPRIAASTCASSWKSTPRSASSRSST